MRYVTDKRLAEIPALANLDPDVMSNLLTDAAHIYGFLRRSEAQREDWVPDDALRAWADRQGLSPERVNAALGLLQDDGRVVSFEDPAPDITPEPVEQTPKGRQADPAEGG